MQNPSVHKSIKSNVRGEQDGMESKSGSKCQRGRSFYFNIEDRIAVHITPLRWEKKQIHAKGRKVSGTFMSVIRKRDDAVWIYSRHSKNSPDYKSPRCQDWKHKLHWFPTKIQFIAAETLRCTFISYDVNILRHCCLLQKLIGRQNASCAARYLTVIRLQPCSSCLQNK